MQMEGELFTAVAVATVGSIVAGSTSIFVWVIRLAAKQILTGFAKDVSSLSTVISTLSLAVQEHRKELYEVRTEIAGMRGELAATRDRIEHLEDRWERRPGAQL